MSNNSETQVVSGLQENESALPMVGVGLVSTLEDFGHRQRDASPKNIPTFSNANFSLEIGVSENFRKRFNFDYP
ncbi:MAG: hypothetical protein HC865_23490 [Cyanobacteria bacterium RU_5_0]|nr:hypothetical protein [Cyanobacteria bacterium RU_5_0]